MSTVNNSGSSSNINNPIPSNTPIPVSSTTRTTTNTSSSQTTTDVLSSLITKKKLTLPATKSPPQLLPPKITPLSASAYTFHADALRDTWGNIKSTSTSYANILTQLQTAVTNINTTPSGATTAASAAITTYRNNLLATISTASTSVATALRNIQTTTDASKALQSLESMKTAIATVTSTLQTDLAAQTTKADAYNAAQAQIALMQINSAQVVQSYYTTGSPATTLMSKTSNSNVNKNASASFAALEKNLASQTVASLASQGYPPNYVGPISPQADYVVATYYTMNDQYYGLMSPPANFTSNYSGPYTVTYQSQNYQNQVAIVNQYNADATFLALNSLGTTTNLASILALTNSANTAETLVGTNIAKNPTFFKSTSTTLAQSEKTASLTTVLNQYQTILQSIQTLPSYSSNSDTGSQLKTKVVAALNLIQQTQTSLLTTTGAVNPNFNTLSGNMADIITLAFPSSVTSQFGNLAAQKSALNTLQQQLITAQNSAISSTTNSLVALTAGIPSNVNASNFNSFSMNATIVIGGMKVTSVSTQYNIKAPSTSTATLATQYQTALNSFNTTYGSLSTSYQLYQNTISLLSASASAINKSISTVNTLNNNTSLTALSTTNIPSTVSSVADTLTQINANFNIKIVLPTTS